MTWRESWHQLVLLFGPDTGFIICLLTCLTAHYKIFPRNSKSSRIINPLNKYKESSAHNLFWRKKKKRAYLSFFLSRNRFFPLAVFFLEDFPPFWFHTYCILHLQWRDLGGHFQWLIPHFSVKKWKLKCTKWDVWAVEISELSVWILKIIKLSYSYLKYFDFRDFVSASVESISTY